MRTDKKILLLSVLGVGAYLASQQSQASTSVGFSFSNIFTPSDPLNDSGESNDSPDIVDSITSFTEPEVTVSDPTLEQYRKAFLQTIQTTEGTIGQPNPYMVLYSYDNWPVPDYSTHPRGLGWPGVPLSDATCRNAGLNPPCKSTAAGAYQITYPTFKRLQSKLGTTDFSPETQDLMALELIREKGALSLVDSGDVLGATAKVSAIWASLPGSTAQQNPQTVDYVQNTFNSLLGVG